MENVTKIVEVKKPSTLKKNLAVVGVFAGAMALTGAANAASLDLSGLTVELDGVKTAVLSIISALLGIGAIVLGYKVIKRFIG